MLFLLSSGPARALESCITGWAGKTGMGAARESVGVDVYDSASLRVYSGKWGRVVQADGTILMDVTNWAPGVYLLRARASLLNGSDQKFPVKKVMLK